VVQVCHLNGVPFLIVRAISDSAAEGTVTEFKRSLKETAADAGQLVVGLLERVVEGRGSGARSGIWCLAEVRSRGGTCTLYLRLP